MSSVFALITYGFIFAILEMMVSDIMPIYVGRFLKNVVVGMMFFLLIKWIPLCL
jgi:hypothetical protein